MIHNLIANVHVAFPGFPLLCRGKVPILAKVEELHPQAAKVNVWGAMVAPA